MVNPLNIYSPFFYYDDFYFFLLVQYRRMQRQDFKTNNSTYVQNSDS